MARPVLRRCAACRLLADRSTLWRVIRDHEDGVVLDQGFGRSAYLCRSTECLGEAIRRKRLQRALRCPVPQAVIAALEERLRADATADAEAR
ncbi:YlxR family protein [Synechococcus sp. RSCCF101]|uniref:YlxR family protein n=1 Tax=Synechococcus sp. RSCCF101 TaxID=2511069 RepID=UPI00351A0469